MLDEAIASYRHAVGIDPYYVEAHYNLGNAYFRTPLFTADGRTMLMAACSPAVATESTRPWRTP